MSETSIFQKLHKVKSKIGKISKDSTNPFFKSKYFDINSLLENIEPLLNENNLLLIQPIEESKVYSRIIDIENGEKVESYLELAPNLKPQERGSEITYYRRYTLQSLLGVQAEDDDGNKASGNNNTPSKTNRSQPEDNRPWITEKALNQILERIKSGEKGLYEQADKIYRMKKTYREQLKNA